MSFKALSILFVELFHNLKGMAMLRHLLFDLPHNTIVRVVESAILSNLLALRCDVFKEIFGMTVKLDE